MAEWILKNHDSINTFLYIVFSLNIAVIFNKVMKLLNKGEDYDFVRREFYVEMTRTNNQKNFYEGSYSRQFNEDNNSKFFKTQEQRRQDVYQYAKRSDMLAPEFRALGFESVPTEEELRKRYRRLAKRHHPDSPTGDEEKFKELKKNYESCLDMMGLNGD